MDLAVNITVAYECKVAETGYKIDEDDNLVPVHQSTRYISKPFSIECIREFNTLFPVGQGKSPQEEAHAKRIAFANNWGVFREEV